MGMFSFVCSDTERALVCYDVDTQYNRKNKDLCTKIAHLLIPKEFGGGSYIVNHNYQGYGLFYDGSIEIDPFERLAFWNLGERDRIKGIELYYKNGMSDEDVINNDIKYPLKIVEVYRPYEMASPCWDDKNQGWGYEGEEEDDDEWEDTED